MRENRTSLKLLCILSCIFLLSACAPEVKYTAYVKPDASKITPHHVMILGQEDELPKNSVILGEIVIGDTGLTMDCDYSDILNVARARARAIGADAIQIVDVILPGPLTTNCYTVKAKIVAFPQATTSEGKTKFNIPDDEYNKFLLSLAGNANFLPVKNPSKRILTTGLSILPPQEKGWYTVRNTPYEYLFFIKRGGGPMENRRCYVTIDRKSKNFKTPDDFLESMKQIFESENDIKKFKDSSLSYDLNPRYGTYCVRYQWIGTYPEQRTASGANLIMKNAGYMFIHPKYSKYIVDIGYSEIGTEPGFSPLFKKIADEFIDNAVVKGKE